jgi:alpha-ribazole phosphatase
MTREEVLVGSIFENLEKNSNIISSNIVGSIENMDLENISDIDIVVIVKKLSLNLVESIKNSLLSINLKEINIDKQIYINDTFGPLKFDNKNNIVFHLMIYDLNLHLEHVKKSPFTCFDWERSENFRGISLKDLSSVHKLMLNDFVNSRRGTKEYLEDITKKKISYRKYELSNDELVQTKMYYDLDDRHEIEFAYHIIYNSISNLLKVHFNNNEKLKFDKFINVWSNVYSELYDKYGSDFKNLYNLKIKKEIDNLDTVELISNFLTDFDFLVNQELEKSDKVVLIRHFKTKFNDGRLLGSENDVNINNDQEIFPELQNFNFSIFDIYTSPSVRCIDTLSKINLSSYKISEDLKEINYGKAEGLFFDELIREHPYISNALENQIDFKFPDGEDNTMVINRVSKLLSKLKKDSVLFTHQGVIRCLIGTSLDIPINKWYLINIPHGYPIEFLKINENYSLNIDRKTLSAIMENFNAEI